MRISRKTYRRKLVDLLGRSLLVLLVALVLIKPVEDFIINCTGVKLDFSQVDTTDQDTENDSESEDSEEDSESDNEEEDKIQENITIIASQAILFLQQQDIFLMSEKYTSKYSLGVIVPPPEMEA